MEKVTDDLAETEAAMRGLKLVSDATGDTVSSLLVWRNQGAACAADTVDSFTLEGIEILCFKNTGEDVSLAASAGAGASTFEGRSGGCSHV